MLHGLPAGCIVGLMLEGSGVSQGALDLRLGMQALDRELITPEQLREAIAEQARRAGKPGGALVKLAAVLVSKGYLTENALAELQDRPPPKAPADLEAGRRKDLRLRELLLRGGVPQEHLDEAALVQAQALAEGRGSVRPLAELMVDLGYATAEAISRILAVQKKAALACRPCNKRYNVTNYYPLKEYRCFHCKGLLEPTGEESRGTGMDWAVVQAPLAADLKPIGKFQLKREIGKGGMGVVYEALDTQLNRRVAIKLMLTSAHAEPEEIKLDEERFIRECQLAARLNHPNIVTVYEAGVHQGRRYLAMEFVEGAAFSDWRKQGSITIRQQVSVVRDVAKAVHAAHELGVMHRDLKPANILMDAKNQPHVMDFGLAKVVGTNTTLSLTVSGAIVGTPSYMSPEQARGVRAIDRRADVWSLGVMIYEIMTGRLPFQGENALEVLMKVMKDPVVPPSKMPPKGRPAVDPVLESISLKALAKKPEDRYATSDLLARDLSRWLKGEQFQAAPWPKPPPRHPPRPGPRSRRPR